MKRSPRSRLLAGSIALLAVTSFVAACGDDDDTAATTTTASSDDTVTETVTGTVTDETQTDDADETLDTTDGTEGSTPGDGSASGDESEYVAALRQNISLEDDDIATCLSQAIVDEIGFDRIEASGLSPDDFANSGGQLSEEEPALTPEQAPALQAAFLECGDLADAFITNESVPQEQKDCERKAIDDEITAALLANQLTTAEDSEEVAAAVEQATSCSADATTTTTTTG